jgi:hypothetical protein
MKTPKLLLAALSLAAFSATAQAQTLFYSTSTNGTWQGATAWNTTGVANAGDQAWADNNTAVFGPTAAALTVTNNATRALTGLTNSGNLTVTIQNSSNSTLLQMSGGTINATGTLSAITVNGGFAGDFTKTGLGTFTLGSTNSNVYNATATVNQGGFTFNTNARTGTSSNAILGGGTVTFNRSSGADTYSFGALSGSSGSVVLAQNPSGSGQSTATVTSLSSTGSGFSIGVVTSANGNATSNNPDFTVNQSVNTTFTGNITGAVTNTGTFSTTRTRLSLTKNGTGDLTMTGAINNLERTTNINGGRLIINSATTSFSSHNGTTAISVNNGGTLGGTGTITTLAGDNIVVADGGKLEAGLDGSAGKLTMALANATLDISAATAGVGTGWLRFDLGANTTAGTTYDQFDLTGGALKIGTANLSFADFDFNAIAGFGAGNYTLFQTTTAIDGSLSDSNSGTINGLSSSLSISGNNLILTAVPEPSTWALIACSLATLVVLRRRRHI